MHNVFEIKIMGYYQRPLTLDGEVRIGPYNCPAPDPNPISIHAGFDTEKC